MTSPIVDFAPVVIAQGSLSSGLAVGQPRYDESSGERRHARRDPDLVAAAATELRGHGVEIVGLNGLEQLSADGQGRAGIDQLAAFSWAFGGQSATAEIFPLLYMGADPEQPRDRVAIHERGHGAEERRSQRAPFGNALVVNSRYQVVGGYDALLPVLGAYNRFDAHEPRGLLVRDLYDRRSNAHVRVAVTELADRNPTKDPDGRRDVENALQLAAVLQALETGGATTATRSPGPLDVRVGLDASVDGPRRPTLLLGNLNRDADVLVPSRAGAWALVARLRADDEHPADLIEPAVPAGRQIDDLVKFLPVRPMKLRDVLASANVVVPRHAGPTGAQQGTAPKRLDYVGYSDPDGLVVGREAQRQVPLPVGFRKFTIGSLQIAPTPAPDVSLA